MRNSGDAAVSESEAAVVGFLDKFVPPRSFIGWAAFEDELNRRRDIIEDAVVSVHVRDEVIATCVREYDRKDVGGRYGFQIEAKRDLTTADVFSDGLTITLSAGERQGRLVIPPQATVTAKVISALDVLVSSIDHIEPSIQAIYDGIANSERRAADKSRLLATLATVHPISDSDELNRLAKFAVTGIVKDNHVNVAALSDYEVVKKFESIGLNCEFGILQRRYKYEPISLFRFAAIEYDKLILALQSGLEGIGEPEYTVFDHFYDGSKEYGTADTRYGMKAHTFITELPATKYEREYQKQCRRLAWLAAAFVDNLKNQSKVLVRTENNLSMDQIETLFNELNKYGRNKLLVVKAKPERAGIVEVLRPDLYVGYLKKVAAYDDVNATVDVEEWMNLLRNVASMSIDY